jgi:hypothetical protein
MWVDKLHAQRGRAMCTLSSNTLYTIDHLIYNLESACFPPHLVMTNLTKSIPIFISLTYANVTLASTGQKNTYVAITMTNLAIGAMTLPTYVFGRKLRSVMSDGEIRAAGISANESIDGMQQFWPEDVAQVRKLQPRRRQQCGDSIRRTRLARNLRVLQSRFSVRWCSDFVTARWLVNTKSDVACCPELT